MVIQDPGINPDFATPPDTGQGPIYLPTISQLYGIGGLDGVTTIGLTLNTLVQFTVCTDLQFFQLLPGAANGAITDIEVSPLDYNADTNNVHWRLVGGFGISLMAGARIFNSGNIAIPNNINTIISFNSARFNSGEWDSGVNPSRITCAVDGIYCISGSVSFAAAAGGSRKVSIRQNGSTELATQQPVGTPTIAGTANTVNLSVSTITKLNAGDYVELTVLQTSGADLNVLSAAQYSPEFSAVRLSSLLSVPEIDFTIPSPKPNDSGLTVTDLSLTDSGWYRIWQGSYPSSGSFEIERILQDDGQTSDTIIDFTIIGDTPEGVINVNRNAIPVITSPSIDAVRVSHLVSSVQGYVDVHITRGGSWRLTYKSNDTDFLAAPYIVPDDIVTPGLVDASFVYYLKANVIGGSGAIDITQINSGDQLFAKPQPNTWALWTGTPSRVTKDTATATTADVAQHLKALIDDLVTIGIIRVGVASSMTYSAMLNLTPALVSENLTVNLTDIFRISAAPDANTLGIYIPVGTLNGHTSFKLQGYSWSTANGRCEWSTNFATWTIYSENGTRLYHSAAAEANPWLVAQWKDEASANVAVTTIAPNIPMTFNLLTDTHTAQDVTGTSSFNGFYLRVADVNAKRSYKLVGTSSNNKRIEWTGTLWQIKDDSSILASSSEDVVFPDQVTTWVGISDSPTLTGLSAVNLMGGVTINGGTGNPYNGKYVTVKGAYNNLGGRKLIYRRVDGAFYIENDGSKWSILDGISGAIQVTSNNNGSFPWSASWTAVGLIAQQSNVASPGWVANTTFPNMNTTGNWHL